MIKRTLPFLLFLATFHTLYAIQTPSGVVGQAGDASVILHWDPVIEPSLAGYRVYRSSSSGGPFTNQTPSVVTTAGYCDVAAVNGQTNFYEVTAVNTLSQESAPSSPVALSPHVFASDDEFLDYLQQANFDYFYYLANPNNGLIPDRSAPGSACSIAAVGFGLTAIGIGVDHGWITRSQGAARVQTTLNTFLQGPQGTNTSGVIGYKGWFYHFLDMGTGLRAGGTELSSIDTTLLLGGVLYAKQYFDGTNATEIAIRAMADTIFNRVDWQFMSQGTAAVAMGWQPTSGFSGFGNWVGYNEAMLLYILGLGTATNPLPTTAWAGWTNGYTWATNYGYAYVPLPPLFTYHYSHCWVDFRHVTDGFMASHNSSYFENSRRAALAQRAYAVANPLGKVGYSSTVWGLTACDGPNQTINGVTYAGYAARGAPGGFDDGTIAPTAAGGSIAFASEASVPTLRYFYKQFRRNIWTSYGFRDAFNFGAQWWDTDELGIDQGPIVVMIENYRSQRIWQLFMQNAEIQRGLQRAGFISVPFVAMSIQPQPAQNSMGLTWNAVAGRTYELEFSPDLAAWFQVPTGEILATGPTATWTDNGPPGTPAPPFAVPQRYYRSYQLGLP